MLPISVIRGTPHPLDRIVILQGDHFLGKVLFIADSEPQTCDAVDHGLSRSRRIGYDDRNSVRRRFYRRQAVGVIPERRKHRSSCLVKFGEDFLSRKPAGDTCGWTKA